MLLWPFGLWSGATASVRSELNLKFFIVTGSTALKALWWHMHRTLQTSSARLCWRGKSQSMVTCPGESIRGYSYTSLGGHVAHSVHAGSLHLGIGDCKGKLPLQQLVAGLGCNFCRHVILPKVLQQAVPWARYLKTCICYNMTMIDQ